MMPARESDRIAPRSAGVRGADARDTRRRPGDLPVTTDRRAAFVELYVSGEPPVRSHATRAAEAAGFARPAKQGPRLLTVPEVAERVEALFLARWVEPEGPGAVETDRSVILPPAHVGKGGQE